MFGEAFKVFFVLGKNEDVIHVYDAKSLFDFVFESVIHYCLKCQGGIAQSKEQNGRLIKSKIGLEIHIPLIAIFDAYIVESPSNIEFFTPEALILSMISNMSGSRCYDLTYYFILSQWTTFSF